MPDVSAPAVEPKPQHECDEGLSQTARRNVMRAARRIAFSFMPGGSYKSSARVTPENRVRSCRKGAHQALPFEGEAPVWSGMAGA